MISICLRKHCLALIVVLLIAGSARAGGLDYQHYWAFEIGKHKCSVSEIESMGRPGIRFTRVQIQNASRIHGRDFQCGIWNFSAVAILVPLGGVIGLVMLLQRRQRNAL